MSDEFKSFEALVTWATWFVVEEITRGKPLRSALFHVLSVALEWKPEQKL
jgi:hypothetical protein